MLLGNERPPVNTPLKLEQCVLSILESTYLHKLNLIFVLGRCIYVQSEIYKGKKNYSSIWRNGKNRHSQDGLIRAQRQFCFRVRIQDVYGCYEFTKWIQECSQFI